MNAWIILMQNVAEEIEHDLYRGGTETPNRGRRWDSLRRRSAHALIWIADRIEPERPTIDSASECS